MNYDFVAIEKRWQAYWEEHQTFRAPNPGEPQFDPARPKYYVLDMFPYPSGIGLHVGHPLGYIATDIVARYKRMRGFNVLHPMGFDAFGLPAEQFAVEHGVHPRVTTEQNIANMVRQLKRLGLSYDWSRSLATTDVEYYRWTQWIFLRLFNSWFDPAENKARPIAELEHMLANEQMFVGMENELVPASNDEGMTPISGDPIGSRKWHELSREEQHAVLDSHRLAFLDEVPVNWCPALGTVLANEEVTADGRSERGNHPVYKRPLKQWMLRITAYGDRLADDLEAVDWPEPIKLMQRNWIGRSEGAVVDFRLHGIDDVVRVFTTRPDTLFGATYMVLAPEHPLVQDITTAEQRAAVHAYQKQALSRSDIDRMADTRTKTGVFTGAYAVNPVNGENIPVWIADYVLWGYGTGAIMAVPAHDTRDFMFATQFNLPIKDVVYSPVLMAVQGFCKRAVPDEPEAENYERLVDFVALCVNQNRRDYDNVWMAINARRRDPTGDPGISARGSISMIWRDTLKTLCQPGVKSLIAAGRKGQLVVLTNAPLTEEGFAVNSEFGDLSLNGLGTEAAKAAMIDWLRKKGVGASQVQYKLRDWLFSRQRYWGEPFPILHGQDGEVIGLDDSELPVMLPDMEDFRPAASDDPNAPPRPPLARAPDTWKHHERRGQRYTREFNTMPQWAGSCWYYLRFLDPRNNKRFVGEDVERYWMLSRKKSAPAADKNKPADPSHYHSGGIDLYVGGCEHAVLHLLYARFWHKVLYDLGYVSTPEPFGRLFNQGYIQAYAYTDERGIYVSASEVEEKDGRFQYQGKPVKQEFGKMGKSLKNAIAPDEVCEEYGCDTLRLYEMYMGPLDQSKIWRTRDIAGPQRFLQRVWRNFVNEETGALKVIDAPADEKLRRLLHKTIRRVTDDMERMSFNTAIAALIELNNELVALENLPREVATPFVLLLAPLAPHIGEELWKLLGHQETLAHAPWPKFDPALLVDDQVEYPVQVNGKLRGKITVPSTATEEQIRAAAEKDEKVQASLDGRNIVKVIVVKGKMVNLVVK